MREARRSHIEPRVYPWVSIKQERMYWGDFFNNQEEEAKAYERKKSVYHICLEWLIENRIQSFQINSDGLKKKIEPNMWQRPDAFDFLDAATMLDKTPFYFEKEHIEMLIRGETGDRAPTLNKTSILEEESNISKPNKNPRNAGRSQKFDPAFYSAILAFIDQQEDVIASGWKKDRIEREIIDIAQNKYPDKEHPSPSWLRQNITCMYLETIDKINRN